MTSTALPVLDTPVPAPEALQNVLGLPQRVFRTREVSIDPLIWFVAEEVYKPLKRSQKGGFGVLAPCILNQTLRSPSLKKGSRHPVCQSRQITVHDVQLTKTNLQHSEPEGPWCRSLPPLLGHRGASWPPQQPQLQRPPLGLQTSAGTRRSSRYPFYTNSSRAQQNHLHHAQYWCFAASRWTRIPPKLSRSHVHGLNNLPPSQFLPQWPLYLLAASRAPRIMTGLVHQIDQQLLATWRCNHSSAPLHLSIQDGRMSDDGKELSQIVGKDVKMWTDSWWSAVVWSFGGP